MSLKLNSVLCRWPSRLLNDLSGQMTKLGEQDDHVLGVPTCDHVKSVVILRRSADVIRLQV